MQRRQFIVSTLAAPVVALPSAALAGMAPEPKPEGIEPSQNPLAPETFLNVEMKERDGELFPTRIIGSDRELKKDRYLETRRGRGGPAYGKIKFEPLKSSRRFLLVMTEWGLPLDYYNENGVPRFDFTEEELQAYHAAADAFPDPLSLLDIPHPDGDNEEELTEAEWYTREEAFAKAAEYNADEAANNIEEFSRVYRCHWFLVVEIGRPVIAPLVNLELNDGVGVMSSSRDFPLRLVQPTEAEKARYPFSAVLDQFEDVAVEGGVA